MDANRFDDLSRALAGRTNRREAVRRGGMLAAIAGALGMGGIARAQDTDDEENPDDVEDEDEREPITCEFGFVSTVVVGPNERAVFNGILTIEIGPDGEIDDGSLQLEGGRPRPVVGQATGRALDLRIEIGTTRVLSLSGVGEFPIEECRGPIAGTFAGPEFGDIGAWTIAADDEEPTPVPGQGDDSEVIIDTPDDSDSDSDSDGGSDSDDDNGPGPVTCEPVDCGITLVQDPNTCECACPDNGVQCGEACCPTGAICGSGSNCSCPSGTVICGTACVPDCGPGSSLDFNSCTCVQGCPPGQELCNGQCVNSCGSGQQMNMATCVCENVCPSGQALCNQVCIDVVNDEGNCGTCGNSCPPGMPCIAGTCQCPATTKYCAATQTCIDQNATCQ